MIRTNSKWGNPWYCESLSLLMDDISLRNVIRLETDGNRTPIRIAVLPSVVRDYQERVEVHASPEEVQRAVGYTLAKQTVFEDVIDTSPVGSGFELHNGFQHWYVRFDVDEQSKDGYLFLVLAFSDRASCLPYVRSDEVAYTLDKSGAIINSANNR